MTSFKIVTTAWISLCIGAVLFQIIVRLSNLIGKDFAIRAIRGNLNLLFHLIKHSLIRIAIAKMDDGIMDGKLFPYAGMRAF